MQRTSCGPCRMRHPRWVGPHWMCISTGGVLAQCARRCLELPARGLSGTQEVAVVPGARGPGPQSSGRRGVAPCRHGTTYSPVAPGIILRSFFVRRGFLLPRNSPNNPLAIFEFRADNGDWRAFTSLLSQRGQGAYFFSGKLQIWAGSITASGCGVQDQLFPVFTAGDERHRHHGVTAQPQGAVKRPVPAP